MSGKSKWLQARARKPGETRGRDTLFDEPLLPRAVKLPEAQARFIRDVGGDEGQSHGLRLLTLAYRTAVDAGQEIELTDYERGSYTVNRTSYGVPKSILDIAKEAGGGAYMRGFRLIVKAAMEGKFPF